MTGKRLWFRLTLALLALGICLVWISFRIEDSSPLESKTASLAAKVISESRNHAATQPGRPANLANTVPGPAKSDALVGQIVNSDGIGLPGIKIRLRTLRRSNRGFFVRQAVTDSTGVFELGALDPDGVYMLSTDAKAEFPGYRLDSFTLDSLPDPFKIELAPLALVEISATIVDAEHAPVADFTLTIDSLDHHYPAQTVTSDASGYFRLEAFPAGKLKFYTASSDYFRILGLQAKTDDYRNLTLVIDRGRYRLEGRILDPGGLPIESTRVTLTSEIIGNEYRSQAFRTRHTDATGRFEFTELGGITQVLGIYATGYKPHIENYTFQKFSDRLEIQLLY